MAIDAYGSLVPLPFVAVVVNRLISRINKQFRRIQEQFAGITSKVQENLSGIRIIKAYVQEDQEIVQFKELNREMIRRNIDIAKTHATMHSSIELLLGLGIMHCSRKAAAWPIEGKSASAIWLLFWSTTYAGWPMIAVWLGAQSLAARAGSTVRVVEIFKLEPDIRNNEQTDFSISKINGDIEFVGVHFSYDRNEPPVLRGIDLKIAAGKTLAIVGPTGAGKSTLVNLIPRLIEPTQGQILVDGRDIRSLPLQLLRENIGYVPQETFLFSDTLRENIAYGICCRGSKRSSRPPKPHRSRSILTNCRWAGYDDRRKRDHLVRGQKQRTAISRAVIRQPRFLILDDALSAVDTYTEEEILQRLKTVMQQRTTILVSHRVSTVRYADEIIVLQDGCITQRGKHHDLIQTPGYYRDLYKRQQLEKSLEQL
jgi:ATP-binding cassette subfamily B protein